VCTIGVPLACCIREQLRPLAYLTAASTGGRFEKKYNNATLTAVAAQWEDARRLAFGSVS